MEDEGFVDDGFIEETAWEYFGRYGGRAHQCCASSPPLPSGRATRLRRRLGAPLPKPQSASPAAVPGRGILSERTRDPGVLEQLCPEKTRARSARRSVRKASAR